METFKSVLERYFAEVEEYKRSIIRLLPKLMQKVDMETARELIKNEEYNDKFFYNVYYEWQSLSDIDNFYYTYVWQITDYLDNYRQDFVRVGEILCELLVSFENSEI